MCYQLWHGRAVYGVRFGGEKGGIMHGTCTDGISGGPPQTPRNHFRFTWTIPLPTNHVRLLATSSTLHNPFLEVEPISPLSFKICNYPLKCFINSHNKFKLTLLSSSTPTNPSSKSTSCTRRSLICLHDDDTTRIWQVKEFLLFTLDVYICLVSIYYHN